MQEEQAHTSRQLPGLRTGQTLDAAALRSRVNELLVPQCLETLTATQDAQEQQSQQNNQSMRHPQFQDSEYRSRQHMGPDDDDVCQHMGYYCNAAFWLSCTQLHGLIPVHKSQHSASSTAYTWLQRWQQSRHTAMVPCHPQPRCTHVAARADCSSTRGALGAMLLAEARCRDARGPNEPRRFSFSPYVWLAATCAASSCCFAHCAQFHAVGARLIWLNVMMP